MATLETDFAGAVRRLRPALIQTARRLRRCSYEDAEDLVSEVVLIALARLPEYAQEDGVNGLRPWLTGILHWVAQRDYRQESCQISTEPLSAGAIAEERGHARDAHAFDFLVVSLPRTHRRLVTDWLDGYAQDEIARRNRLHRNTVAVRLEEAFASLRLSFPDAETMVYSAALFAYCSRVSIYRKPKASWLPWVRQHPPERPFHGAAGHAAVDAELESAISKRL